MSKDKNILFEIPDDMLITDLEFIQIPEIEAELDKLSAEMAKAIEFTITE